MSLDSLITYGVDQTEHLISIDGISRLDVPGKNYKYLKLSDLHVRPVNSSENLVTLKVESPTFLLDTRGLPYLHFMQDALGQFLLLRSLIPGLNLKILTSSDSEAYRFYDTFRLRYYSILFTTLNLTKDSFILVGNSRGVLFSETYLISPDGCTVFQDLLKKSEEYRDYNITNLVKHVGFTEYQEYRVDVASQLNSLLGHHKTPFAPDKKIFISREGEESTARRMEKYVDMYNAGLKVVVDESESADIEKLAKDENSLKFYSEMLRLRVLPSKEMDKIVRYYELLGYRSIRLEELSLSNQIYIMSGATHVAALPGSGIYNCIYCQPDTKIDLIIPSDAFFMGNYEDLFDALFADYRFFPKNAVRDGSARYSALDILSDVHEEKVGRRYE